MKDDNDGLCIINRYAESNDDEDSDGIVEETSNTLKAENSDQKDFQSRAKKLMEVMYSNHMNDETSITEINDNYASQKRKKRKPKHKKAKASQPNEDKDMNFCQIGQIKNAHIEKIESILPKWLSNPKEIAVDLKGENVSVTEIPYLDETSKHNLKQAGINFLFPVQLAVVPWLLKHEKVSLLIRPPDLCVSSPTGSGKTLAFALPIVQSLKGKLVKAIRAVIVLPTSVLAMQVYNVFKLCVQGTHVKVAIISGQKSFSEEQQILVRKGVEKYRSVVDIIVTTPGRILDHIASTEGFSLKDLRYLVIDEADRMMSDIEQGWLKQIEDAVYGKDNASNSKCTCFSGVEYKRIRAPAASVCEARRLQEPLQKLLFSATLSHDPEKLHMLSLYRPVLFAARNESYNSIGKCTIPDSIRLYSVICSPETKPIALCHFLKQRQFKRVLCFTNRVERTERLKLVLDEMALFRVKEISSKDRPVQRRIIMSQFTSGKVDILICSDLVARGMDFENVDCVISYDVPDLVKTFIHRIGRTARAGKEGTAATFIADYQIPSFTRMLVSASVPVPEEITIRDDDLKSYVALYKNALTVADSKRRAIESDGRPQNKRKKWSQE